MDASKLVHECNERHFWPRFSMLGYTGPGTTWANGMNFVMNHDPCQIRDQAARLRSRERSVIMHKIEIISYG